VEIPELGAHPVFDDPPGKKKHGHRARAYRGREYKDRFSSSISAKCREASHYAPLPCDRSLATPPMDEIFRLLSYTSGRPTRTDNSADFAH